MNAEPAVQLEAIVIAIGTRFFAQNNTEPPAEAELRALAGRLFELVRERRLPRPLAEDESGAPGGMPDEECAAGVRRLLAGSENGLAADMAKQLVKAFFYPDFKVCRDSYSETKADGTCKRQERTRVAGRASGTHCVDCPYWTALEPDAHERLLVAAWRCDPEEFIAHRELFLPEDFRALRHWRAEEARRQHSML